MLTTTSDKLKMKSKNIFLPDCFLSQLDKARGEKWDKGYSNIRKRKESREYYLKNRERILEKNKARFDITGNRYGRLTVIKRVLISDKRARWECKCDCGETTVVRGSSLRNGNTRSCGCLRAETRAWLNIENKNA